MIGQSWDFVPAGRPPLPPPWRLGHQKIEEEQAYIYVYFAFQTIMCIFIFHENVQFFCIVRRLGLGIGVPPPLFENLS